jgi:protein phosphatase
MGGQLSQPVLSQILERQGSAIFKIGGACINGYRKNFEDAHVIHISDDFGFFGVFDGHSGDTCSHYIKNKFLEFSQLLKKEQFPLHDNTIKNECLHIDKQFLDMKLNNSGSAGTFFFAHKTGANSIHLQVGNVGDSRVIISQKSKCISMTTDHKPNDTEEKKRIVSCGGYVENNRVNGGLALSRAFGDSEYKQNGYDQLNQQVIAHPDINHIDLSLDGNDYAILACDGLFESNFTNEQVINFINRQLVGGEKDLALIASRLCSEAILRGSKDNISCYIVQFCDGVNFGTGPPCEDFIPGPISLPKDTKFMKIYFEMSKLANFTPGETLQKRWYQIYNSGSNLSSIIPKIEEVEKNIFKDVPSNCSEEELRAFFTNLHSTLSKSNSPKSTYSSPTEPGPGPLARALALQQQLGIPLYKIIEIMHHDTIDNNTNSNNNNNNNGNNNNN